MHILVTNDDGVYAPGLLALVQELRKIGHVSVVAPDRNWSASGHVKTLSRPLRVKAADVERIRKQVLAILAEVDERIGSAR